MGSYINELRQEKEKIEDSLVKLRQIMENTTCIGKDIKDAYEVLKGEEKHRLQQLADVECKIKNEE